MKGNQEAARLGYGAAKHDPHGPLITQLARDALAIVLAGGRGSRLGPLTDWRWKPPVALGGKFRINDFPLSNCVETRLRRLGLSPPNKDQSPTPPVPRGLRVVYRR